MSDQDPTQGGEAAYIPLGYYADFLKFLNANRNRIQVITYSDLDWSGDFNHTRGYPEEKRAWEQGLRDGRWDSDKIYVLLQHDVDTRPERTEQMLEIEEKLNIPSNVMIFTQRVNRRHLQATGELLFTEYDLDYAFLKRLEHSGFEIAYHSNAHEKAHFDMARAQEVLRKDVMALREHFDIRFFSAHGGTPSPDGKNNRDVPLPDDLGSWLRWVHNGASPYFTKSYSDGGINSPKRDPSKRDLRDFVREWRPGGRYRVITHPQYYNDPCNISPRLQGTPWYDEVRQIYNTEKSSAWVGVAPRAITRKCYTHPEIFGLNAWPETAKQRAMEPVGWLRRLARAVQRVSFGKS